MLLINSRNALAKCVDSSEGAGKRVMMHEIMPIISQIPLTPSRDGVTDGAKIIREYSRNKEKAQAVFRQAVHVFIRNGGNKREPFVSPEPLPIPCRKFLGSIIGKTSEGTE